MGVILIVLVAIRFRPGRTIEPLPTPTDTTSIEVIDTPPVAAPRDITDNVLFESVNVTNQKTMLVLDAKTQYLVEINGDKKRNITTEAVNFFAYENPTVIYQPSAKPDTLVKLNTKTNARETLDMSDFGQVIAISITEDLKDMYVLSNYSHITRKAKLYKTSLEKLDLKLVTDTSANSVRSLPNGRVVLYEFKAGIDESIFVVYDTNQNKQIFKTTAQTYALSPNKEIVYIFTTIRKSIFEVSTGQQSILINRTSPRAAWKDNDTVVFIHNDRDKLTLTEYNIQTARERIFKEIKTNDMVRSVLGVSGETIFAESVSGAIIQIEI